MPPKTKPKTNPFFFRKKTKVVSGGDIKSEKPEHKFEIKSNPLFNINTYKYK
jgi:hypothetical protein